MSLRDTRTAAESSAPRTVSSRDRFGRRAFRPSSGGLPRPLPWGSGMTRVWAGTKIVCLAAVTTTLLLWPQWSTIAAVVVALLLGSLVARVPPSALPRLPVWFWSGVVGGIIGSWLGGGVWIFVRALVVAGVIVWGSSLLIWTTHLEVLTPALRTLLAPLRLLRVPVDEWSTAMVIALRGLPTLNRQTSAVSDAVRLRSGGRPPDGWKEAVHLVIDIITASLSASSRRAADTGRAMTMRGGVPPVPADRFRWGWRDLAAMVVTGEAVAVAVLLRSGWPDWLVGALPWLAAA